MTLNPSRPSSHAASCAKSAPKPLAVLAALLLGIALAPAVALALEADELALVVNRNVPAGLAAAAQYAKARGVPDGRIISLDLPFADECSFQQFEESVVPIVRAFLRDHHLDAKVRCLVTFYGVPLRIAEHKLTPDERAERDDAERELKIVRADLLRQLEDFEHAVHDTDPAYKPPTTGTSLPDIERRGADALRALAGKIKQTADPTERAKLNTQGFAFLQALGGQIAVWDRAGAPMLARPGLGAAERAKLEATKTEADRLKAETSSLADRRYDPAARSALRRDLKQSFGLLNYARGLQGTVDYLAENQTTAAFDSELALLWWGFYDRGRWQGNPMYLGNPTASGAPAIVMTCRLDAPDPSILSAMIARSLQVEHDGLTGRVVCDARGKHNTAAKTDAYASYDQTIRALADLVENKTRLPLTFDDAEALIPPHSAKNVALYVGWYSVGHYVPCCDFAAGAVGYHVASYELTSLRDQQNHGWCRGLLEDGITATLGPVAEPYLGAFPAADEFFPLLMTGKLSLAEVYWRTEPMTSWQMCLIGDPLYTPFGKRPALAVDDLPDRLKRAIATHPPTAPASAPTSRP